MKATRCSVSGCPRRHAARGLCDRHYANAYRRKALPPIQEWGIPERLARGLVADADGCLVWTRGKDSSGYGVLVVGERKTERTHRVAWMLANGPIPEGLYVLHRCDNRPCCNVAHLFLGTREDNIRDMVEKGRARNAMSSVTHCPRGHEYTEANTYKKGRGGRQCRICRKARDSGRRDEKREYQRRRRAAIRARESAA